MATDESKIPKKPAPPPSNVSFDTYENLQREREKKQHEQELISAAINAHVPMEVQVNDMSFLLCDRFLVLIILKQKLARERAELFRLIQEGEEDLVRMKLKLSDNLNDERLTEEGFTALEESTLLFRVHACVFVSRLIQIIICLL